MTNTLKRLESKGFIKIRPNDTDGRSKEVSITNKGRKIRELAIAATEPELVRVVQALGEEEIARLLPSLQKLREWLDTHR